MTERQYNSNLLSDKLSQLPVPPNDLLWSKIEAQLIAATPVSHPLKVAPRFTKAVLIKTSITIFSTILLVLLILWIVRKQQHSQKVITPIPKQVPIADTAKPAVATVDTVFTQQQKIPQLLPKKKEQQIIGDTVENFAPIHSLHSNDMSVSIWDSLLPIPATTQVTVDSIKLKTIPLKKDDGYYFEIKKKGH